MCSTDGQLGVITRIYPMKIICINMFSLLIVALCSCNAKSVNVDNLKVSESENTISWRVLGEFDGNSLIVKNDVDLQGHRCKIPIGIALHFKGGVISNGTLEGNATPISYRRACFDQVRIVGSWNVQVIKTSMFKDLSYDNALIDVMALTRPEVRNKVIIEKGVYYLKAQQGGKCLSLCSNTELIIDGEIRLKPNEFKGYSIIYVNGENIKIKGAGVIIGDKDLHKGTEGEWGMGVRFHGATNSSLDGISVRDCWGDCVYVGGRSKGIEIKNCILENGRRQGISVTNADGVKISHCKIMNIAGTAPEYAIDLEPNRDDTVTNILVEYVEVNNCKGGFLATRGTKSNKTSIGKIEISNCTVSVRGKYPIRIRKSQNLLVDRCIIHTTNIKPAISMEGVEKSVATNNRIYIKQKAISTVRNKVNAFFQGEEYNAINVSDCLQSKLNNNRVVIR